MVPEEVFISEIEGSLNRYKSSRFLANKSVYNRWFPGNLFPRPFLHNIDGLFYDNRYHLLGQADVNRVLDTLEYPVVIKPSAGGYGGKGFFSPVDSAALKKHMEGQKNYVVQELIKQHDFFARFNKHGVNSLRVCVYRSVVTDEFHVLNVAQRMGKGGSLDNETAGGLVRFVKPDGTLNHYAVDKYGEKYLQHPDTGLEFCEKQVIPDFEDMKRLAVQVARQIFLVRLSSLDMCMDKEGRWRLLELNLHGQTIRFAQYGGHAFFGRFTHEVIEYCKQNPWWR